MQDAGHPFSDDTQVIKTRTSIVIHDNALVFPPIHGCPKPGSEGDSRQVLECPKLRQVFGCPKLLGILS